MNPMTEDSSKKSHSNSEKREVKQEVMQELHKIKPKPNEKFRPMKVRNAIKQMIKEGLNEIKEFDHENCQNACKNLSSGIKDKLKNLKLDRYKYIVQVSIGEKKGQGVRMANRCFWDSETDNMLVETFITDKLFCTVTIYGVYTY